MTRQIRKAVLIGSWHDGRRHCLTAGPNEGTSQISLLIVAQRILGYSSKQLQ